MGELSPEQYFLRYAFPCAHVLCDQGRMTEEDYVLLQKLARIGGDITFNQLEEFFPAAFKRIHEVADKEGKDPHSLAIIKQYFLHDHQEYIDAGDGMYAKMPKSFGEFCKVKKLKVLDKKFLNDELFLRVGDERWVRAPFFKEDRIKVGDTVTVHHAFAVELVD